LINGRGAIQWISRCYLLTDYDGDILISAKEELEEKFSLTHIIGDNHFRKAKRFFRLISILATKSAAGRPRMVNGKKVKFQTFQVFTVKWKLLMAGIKIIYKLSQNHFMMTRTTRLFSLDSTSSSL
jgi:cyanophycinase-like exopeptidase